MARSGPNGSGNGPGGRALGINNLKCRGGRYGYRLNERREFAANLAANRAKRSPQEQLALLDERLGESRKERARLMAMIDGMDAGE